MMVASGSRKRVLSQIGAHSGSGGVNATVSDGLDDSLVNQSPPSDFAALGIDLQRSRELPGKRGTSFLGHREQAGPVFR